MRSYVRKNAETPIIPSYTANAKFNGSSLIVHIEKEFFTTSIVRLKRCCKYLKRQPIREGKKSSTFKHNRQSRVAGHRVNILKELIKLQALKVGKTSC
jgi:hypothetical protein